MADDRASRPSLGAADVALIGDHALLGDGRAVALVTRDATVDWFCLPEDPDAVLCDALLDAEGGGRCTIRPADVESVTRRYRSDSMVLETTFRTGTGVLVVDDALTQHNGAPLPWVELARRVRCSAGRVELRWEVEPCLHLGGGRVPLHEHHGLLQASDEDLRIGVLHWGLGPSTPSAHGAGGGTTLVAGDDGLLVMVVVRGEPLPRPDRDEIEARLDRTVKTWQTWSDGIEYTGRWRDQVDQSARALKLLVHEPDGAIMAAPTTSLPERVGGEANYDYRYCWIRDASFTIDALLRIGLVEEAHRAITAVLRMAGRTAPHLVPFYGVDGRVPEEEENIDLPGYRGSRPVQRGNAAGDQLQLGSWGDLFEAVWIYVRQGNDLDARTGTMMTSLADRVCEIWTREDAGIWELPGPRHHTISKMRCWMALDRALRLAEADQLEGDVDRWRSEQHAIRAFVEERCWSESRSSLTFHADTDDLDASCLLAARLGIFAPESDEVQGTIAAVQAELADGPFVWRYSGQRDREGAFLACSFWLAEALVRSGRLSEAEDIIDGVLGAAMNDLGLMSEEYDPDVGEMRGNFPQGLSHLALVNVASFHAEVVRNGAATGRSGG